MKRDFSWNKSGKMVDKGVSGQQVVSYVGVFKKGYVIGWVQRMGDRKEDDRMSGTRWEELGWLIKCDFVYRDVGKSQRVKEG